MQKHVSFRSMTRKEKIIFAIGFNDRKFMLVGIPIVAFSIPFIFFGDQVASGEGPPMLIGFPISVVYTTIFWLVCREIVIRFRLRFPKPEETMRRLLWIGSTVIVGYILIDITLDSLGFFILGDHSVHQDNFRYTISGLTVCTLVLSIYEGIWLFYRWKATMLEAEKLRRETVESQLQGLRSQVNPHFLFNSLNTLTYIIPEDPEKAITFVQKLSKVYRYVLETRDEKLIKLEEELRFLDSYIFLLKERFGQNLHIYQDIPSYALDMSLAPLSLQILLENCIKHNIISADQPLFIELFAEDNQLIVKNNLQLKRQHMPSTGMGLQNIKNRYMYFTREPVVVSDQDGHFTVKLPLLGVPEVVGI